MNIDERMEFLLKSQESLGKNIEELYETVSLHDHAIKTQENEMRRFRRALRAALSAWLEGNNGEGEE